MLDRSKLLVSRRDLCLRDQVSLPLFDLIVKDICLICVESPFYHSLTILVIDQVNLEQLTFCMVLDCMLFAHRASYLPIAVYKRVQVLDLENRWACLLFILDSFLHCLNLSFLFCCLFIRLLSFVPLRLSNFLQSTLLCFLDYLQLLLNDDDWCLFSTYKLDLEIA